MNASLFDPLTLRGATFKNRAWVSPMCQYSAQQDGLPLDWHLVHLGQFAVGGAGLVMTEATSVAPEGRLSPGDTGLWSDDHVEAWSPITRFIRDQGALSGIQLGHAGRKASASPPWDGQRPVLPADGGWETVAPSAIPFGDLPTPRELDEQGIRTVIDYFAEAAKRAIGAGFDVIELHAAHGYLVHEFLSPLSNQRTDRYGGGFDQRITFLVEVVEAMRREWPDDRPLFVRLSATDWVDGGWDLEQTVEAARVLETLGVDLIDCSSGGSVPDAHIPVGPNYQVPFAREVREQTGCATAAVGRITEPVQADEIIRGGSADAIFMGREFLRQPHWPLLAAFELGIDLPWPNQYGPSKPTERHG